MLICSCTYVINSLLNVGMPAHVHSKSAHLLLNNRASIILKHTSCILIQCSSVSNQPKVCDDEKRQDFGEWNAFYSPWASTLGWDQIHDVNLPGFIDAAFCGILIGGIVVVMLGKNVSMKMECTMLGGGLRQDGPTRKKRGV